MKKRSRQRSSRRTRKTLSQHPVTTSYRAEKNSSVWNAPTPLGKDLFCVGLTVALAWLVFLNTLGNSFVSDDLDFIVDHMYTRNPWDITGIFTSTIRENYEVFRKENLYRPITIWSFALNYAAGGLSPVGYHLVKVLLHGLNTALVYLLARVLFRTQKIALVAGLLFALHPIHTEAVAWVSGRAELLAAFFLLSAWLLYLRSFATLTVTRWSFILSLIGFAMAVLSKENALLLPVLLMLSDLMLRPEVGPRYLRHNYIRILKKGFLRYGPYIAVIVLYFAARFVLLDRSFLYDYDAIPFIENPLASLPFLTRALTAVKVVAYYMLLLFWPVTLSHTYSYNAIPLAASLIEPQVVISILAIIGAFILGAITFVKCRQIGFCIIYFFVMLAPASNLLIAIGTIMGERLLYLPSVGLCLLMGILWSRLTLSLHNAGSRALLNAIRAAAILILALLAYRTVLRNEDWKDERSLWGSAAKVVPQSAKVWWNLGKHLADSGRHVDAMRKYENALRIYPTYEGAFVAMGAALIEDGRLDEAIRLYEGRLQAEPENENWRLHLGAVRMRNGEVERAIEEFRAVLEADPRRYLAFRYLAFAFLKSGAVEKAITTYEEALDLYPKSARLHGQYGTSLMMNREFDQAVSAFRKSLSLDATQPEAHNNLAYARATRGEFAEAIESYRRALELRPEDAQIYKSLARVYELNGEERAARSAYRRALELEKTSRDHQARKSIDGT